MKNRALPLLFTATLIGAALCTFGPSYSQMYSQTDKAAAPDFKLMETS